MFRSFFRSRRYFWWAYLGGLVILVGLLLQVEMAVWFNQWEREFWNLIQKAVEQIARGEMDKLQELAPQFWHYGLTLVFSLVLPSIALGSLFGYVTGLYMFTWRQAMTLDYINRWKKIGGKIEGASQRIQEDTGNFARNLEDLGIQFVRAVMTLVTFLPILWNLSSSVNLGFMKNVPGSLVWIALSASLGGIIISWFVGIMLPRLEYNNQKKEAEFRKQLVYGEDNRLNLSVPELVQRFEEIKINYFRMIKHFLYFNVWMGVFGSCMYYVPLFLIGFGALTGVASLGVMKQALNIFAQVNSSFSLFVYNWTRVTYLRSIFIRLREFERYLDECERQESTNNKEEKQVLVRDNLIYFPSPNTR